MKRYYVLFSCDEHKSQSSMSMIGLFNKKGLTKTIRRKIKEQDFVTDETTRYIHSMETKELNNSIQYAYIEEVEMNQEL